MPIYEFRCQSCNNTFEELVRGEQSISCPACESKDIERKMSVCGFVSSKGFVSSAGPSSCSGCTKTNCAGCASLTVGK